MSITFYNSQEYKQKQSEIARKHWQQGLYDSLRRPLETRFCINPSCSLAFQVKTHSSKKFCSNSCATVTNNSKRDVAIIPQKELSRLYNDNGLSIPDIAKQLDVSVHKVTYWMSKHNIPRRSLSEAIYLKNHPNGDPFSVKNPSSMEEAKLLGLGLGLYWGEGNKLNTTSIRLANTDPELIKTFINFLKQIFGVKKQDLRFSLQIFTEEAMNYWLKRLDVARKQFYKTIITPSNSLGTYRKKSQYGVIIVYYHNRKLRDILVGMLPMWLSGRARSW